jgi:cytolysin (calcineurin-like family phosphatase)
MRDTDYSIHGPGSLIADTFKFFLAGFLGVAMLTGCSSSRFSFVVMSDVHLQGGNPRQRQVIDSMLYLANMADRMIRDSTGQSVGRPFALFVTGDLTDSGTPEAWHEFVEIFGLHGDGRLEMPVYETFGNHDGGIKGIVREGIRDRNTRRKDVVMTSENGLHYAVENKGYMFVVLGSYPGQEWDPECEWCHYFRESFREADGSLDFLEQALKKNREGKNLPVFLFFHYGWDDFSRLWWTPAEQDRFYNTLKDSRISGIFHGHNHQIDAYSWRGYNVFIAGSPQRGEKTGDALFVSVRGDDFRVFVIGNNGIRALK